MSVTLKTIAAHVGVSPMVVSAALHNTAGVRVSQAKRELIRRVAHEMGYVPNLSARCLAGGSSQIIGVIIDSEAPDGYFNILRHIEAVASKNGYRIMVIEEHDSIENVVAAYRIFEQYNTEGVICLAHDYPTMTNDFNNTFYENNRLVLLGKAKEVDVPYVDMEPAQAFEEIMSYWSGHGRNIGMLLFDSQNISQLLRKQAFYDACSRLHINPQFYPLKLLSSDEAEIVAQVNQCLDEFILPCGIDAVFAHNDYYAAFLLAILRERKISCPEQLAVVGWGNNKFSSQLYPPLASIDTRQREQGEALFSMLMDLFARKKVDAQFVYPEVVWRESALMKDS